MFRLPFTVVLAVVAVAPQAEPLAFGADPAAARWAMIDGEASCRLEHAVPDFGVARFVREFGRPLVFEIEPVLPLLDRGTVEVFTAATPWRPDSDVEAIAAAPPENGRVRVSGADAERLLAALYRGRSARATQTSTRLDVDVSPVRLRPQFEAFGACGRALAAERFAALERTSVPFGSGGDALPEESAERLLEVARYVAADPAVTHVFVDGHTDASGRADGNLALSRRRAEAVAVALEAAGVAKDRIVVRYHAARYPVAANDTEEGRRDNRRATVRLERVREDPLVAAAGTD